MSMRSWGRRAKNCLILHRIHEFIFKKMEDSRFYHVTQEAMSSSDIGPSRQLSIFSAYDNNPFKSVKNLTIRSIFIFMQGKIDPDSMGKLTTHFKLLQVLVFDYDPIYQLPNDIGDLFNLKYLSLRNTNVEELPKSIGKLHNFETLDLRKT